MSDPFVFVVSKDKCFLFSFESKILIILFKMILF